MTVAIAVSSERLRVTLHGTVQGFGFRPTIYRLASSMRLSGWVRNTGDNLEIEIEGAPGSIANFMLQLKAGKPEKAVVETQETLRLAPTGGTTFEILPSVELKGQLPQIATSLTVKFFKE